MVELSSHSVQETARIAARVAAHLVSGDVVGLSGDLGTGKTRFVEGACRALGYEGRVRSPSYTLLNVYRAAMPIRHFDLYRWQADGAARELAEWEEMMEEPGVTFIEWAERVGEQLPERTLWVALAHAGGDRRTLTLSGPPGRRIWEPTA